MTTHQILSLPDNQLLPSTIATMAKAANEAANMYAMREWAARLATKAPPRDYVRQLKALFDGVMERWRYVQEPGEWVHGTGKSLVRHVLGTKYNGDPDLSRTSLADIATRQKGWGDCDDVSQAIAAGVMALGMTPFFRVVQGNSGGHVSVVARTPRGELVSLDPVGQPEHPFGWMMPAQPNQIRYYDMRAQTAPSLGCDCGPNQPMGRVDAPWVNKTALLRAGQTFKAFAPTHTHYVKSYPGIAPPHVLAVRQGGYLSSTHCMDGLQAVDEHGRTWVFDGPHDLWDLPEAMGGIKDIRRRWKKRIKAVRNVVKKVRELHNKVVSKILSNKVAQKVIGTALMAWGVPPGAAPAVMQTAAELIKKGGLIGLLKTLRKSPKAALRLVAAAAKKGLLATGMVPPAAQKYLKGLDDADGMSLVTDVDGEVTPVWPVSAIIEVPLGAADWSRAGKVPDTAAESQNTSIALAERTTSSRGKSRKSGQSEADWLTNVVLWETYPNSPDVLDPKKAAHKPYVTAWIRINKNVSNGLKVKKVSPASSTPAFAVNTSEGDISRQTVRDNPTSQTHGGVTKAKPSKQSKQDWLTDVAYWRAYPDGPTKLDSKKSAHKNYINAWRRIAVMVKDALTASTPKTTTPKTSTPSTPKTSTPKTSTPSTPKTTLPTVPQSTNCWEDDVRQMSICQDIVKNPEERAIAAEVVGERPKSELVHGTRIHQGTKSATDWLTNVAYWRAYPEGPVEIPSSAKQYADAWMRLKTAVKAELAKAQKPKTPDTTPKIPDKIPDTNLPDLDPREMACLRQNGQWNPATQLCVQKPIEPHIEPKKETNWLPIIAGAAALLLAAKGG